MNNKTSRLSVRHPFLFRVWSFAITVLCELQTVLPLYSDLIHQQNISIHKIFGQFLFTGPMKCVTTRKIIANESQANKPVLLCAFRLCLPHMCFC